MRRFLDELSAVSLVLAVCVASASGQETGGGSQGVFRFALFGDFVTSSRVYPASRDADPTIKSTYYDLGDFLSYGFDARMSLSRANSIGVTLQPLQVSTTTSTIYGYDRSGNYIGVPVKDGFTIYVAELNGYFRIPVVDGDWNIYLGGGVAAYTGKRDLMIGNANASTPFAEAIGIQVLAGVSYKFTDHWGLRTEMKFRSPELNCTSSFGASTTTYRGVQVSLPGTLYSKVNIDGNDFTLGVFFEP